MWARFAILITFSLEQTIANLIFCSHPLQNRVGFFQLFVRNCNHTSRGHINHSWIFGPRPYFFRKVNFGLKISAFTLRLIFWMFLMSFRSWSRKPNHNRIQIYLLETNCSHQFNVLKMIFLTLKNVRQIFKINHPWRAISHMKQKSVYCLFSWWKSVLKNSS